jgi:hypothetical protein
MGQQTLEPELSAYVKYPIEHVSCKIAVGAKKYNDVH